MIEGILSIRMSYSRPSYMTMLSYVNNGVEFNLNMMDIGTIHMKGQKGQESFYISEKLGADTNAPEKLDDVNIFENISNFITFLLTKIKL